MSTRNMALLSFILTVAHMSEAQDTHRQASETLARTVGSSSERTCRNLIEKPLVLYKLLKRAPYNIVNSEPGFSNQIPS